MSSARSKRPARAGVRRAGPLAGSAPLFAALGDETRLAVIHRLSASGPLPVARLCEGARVTRQAIDKHLRVLEQAGLVRARRAGRERIWKLDAGRLAEARRSLKAISQSWDDALQRLKALVET